MNLAREARAEGLSFDEFWDRAVPDRKPKYAERGWHYPLMRCVWPVKREHKDEEGNVKIRTERCGKEATDRRHRCEACGRPLADAEPVWLPVWRVPGRKNRGLPQVIPFDDQGRPKETRPAWRPEGAVLWPGDTDDRHLIWHAILDAKEGWRRAYEGEPPTRQEKALKRLAPLFVAIEEARGSREPEDVSSADGLLKAAA